MAPIMPIEYSDIQNLKGFRIMCHNVCSLTDKKQVDYNRMLNLCDIGVVIESWYEPSDPDTKLDVPGYSFVRLDRRPTIDKRGGGIIIYFKEGLDYNQDVQMTLVTASYEILTVDFLIHEKKYKIIAVYKEPKVHPKALYDKIAEIVDNIEGNCDLIIIGDFNVNYTTANRKTYKIDEFCRVRKLTQVIKCHTRVKPASKTCIDHIYTNSKIVKYTGVFNVNYSDHYPIYMVLKKERNVIEKKCVTARSYKNLDMEDVYRRYLDADWTGFDIHGSPDVMWKILLTNINLSLYTAPLRKMSVPVNKQEWLTPLVQAKMRDRDKLFNKARRTHNTNDWLRAHLKRNAVEAEIFRTKKNILSVLLKNNKKTEDFWKAIRKILPNKNSSKTIKLKDTDTNLDIDPSKIADYINNYFSTIGEVLANKHPTVPIPPMAPDDADDVCLVTNPFTCHDIVEIIKCIDQTKSSNIKNIKTKVLCSIFSKYPEKITNTFNACLRDSSFPQSWKVATVCPIPKKSNSKRVTDLRPISLLPLPGKIMEKLMAKRFREFLKENNILNINQHGFRPKHSTTSATTTYLRYIYDNINKGTNTHSLFLDYSKAFDTVSHPLLLNKLKDVGLSSATCSWFKSYLTNRNQKVLANDKLSQLKCVRYGVPQGSILGPILFTLYINDLPKCAPQCETILYADDAVISSTDINCLISSVKNISKWCAKNLLTINKEKTKWMSIGLNDPPLLSPTIENTVIERVCEFKYLGILIDENLNFRKHEDNVYYNVVNKIHQFADIRKYLDVIDAVRLYKTTILPIMDYIDIVWDKHTVAFSARFQIQQNKALRIAHKVKLEPHPRLNTVELHKESKCRSLHDRRDIHLLIYAHKIQLMENSVLVSNRNTRYTDGLRYIQRYSRNPVVYNCFHHRAIRKWNKLQKEYTLERDFSKYCKKIKHDHPACYTINPGIQF